MNLLGLDEAFEGLENVNSMSYLEGFENQDQDDEFKCLPIGIGPDEITIETD
jgi:ABC-type molybdenum transport system ATPase subunit/photorepair protein PhrA